MVLAGETPVRSAQGTGLSALGAKIKARKPLLATLNL
jgi:hypothetical protein